MAPSRRARSTLTIHPHPPHLQVLLLAPLHLVAQPVELLLDRQTRVIVALKEVLEVEDEVDDGAGPCLEKLYLPIVAGPLTQSPDAIDDLISAWERGLSRNMKFCPLFYSRSSRLR